MHVGTLTMTLFSNLGHHPMKGRCQFWVDNGVICGRDGIGIFFQNNTVSGLQEAHILCREHAETVFLSMIDSK